MVEITDEEAALYDRQIRLWGVDAQRSLRAANVFVKRIGPLGAEVCKNIVLSGVNSLTVLDTRTVEEKHVGTNFLLRTETGKSFAETAVPNLQILNPLVKVSHVTGELSDENISQYTVVCMTDGTKEEYEETNELCRKHGVTFLASNTWGMAGFMFQDCGEEYNYVAERPKISSGKSQGGDKQDPKRRKLDPNDKEEDEEESDYEKRTCQFTEFGKLAELSSLRFSSPVLLLAFGQLSGAEDLGEYCRREVKRIGGKPVPDDLLANLSGTLVPICAILGGIVSQEIIKIVSRKDDPIVNSFFYDGLSGAGIIENLMS